MRKFIDLHLKPVESATAMDMLSQASKLGLSGVGVTHGEKPLKYGETLHEVGLDVIRRIDLRPRSANDLTSTLSRVRRRFEIVAVECTNKAIARQAARDNRVDILNFPSQPQRRRAVRFDRQEASLASGTSCAYEINFSDLVNMGPLMASKMIPMIRAEIENAIKSDVPVVVSSGAAKPLMMRGPRDLAAFTELLGVGEEDSLDMVSENPWHMVNVNRRKLDPGFVSPGVRRV